MKIHVENVLGIAEAEIEILEGEIVEIVGPNGAGKTSMATACQALLARETNPLGIPAAQSGKVYTHEGAEFGQATLVDDGTVITWRPDSGTIEAPNGGPHSTPEAVGLVDYTSRTGAKERAARLQAALLPPAAKLEAEARVEFTRYLPERDVVGVMVMIRERGWEAATSVYADRAREAKRQWRLHTNRTWGVRVGSDWRPDGWLADLDHMTHQQAQENVVAARDALSALHTVKAVSEAEQAEAEAAKTDIERLTQAVERAQATLEPYERKFATADAELEKGDRDATRLERLLADAKKQQHCPYCEKPLRVSKGAIVPPNESLDVEKLEIDVASAKSDRAKLEQARKTAQEAITPFREALNEAKTQLAVAKQTAAKAGTVVPNHTEALAKGEADVEKAIGVVAMIERYEAAAELHQTIIEYTEIANTIGPTGVRSRMLTSGLNRLNAGLRVLSDTTKWPEMLADEKGGLMWDGRPVQSCSESERWRAQASMQLTIGALSDAKVVVLDRFDLLDESNRVSCIHALKHVATRTGVAIVLCGTSSETFSAGESVRVECGGVIR